MPRDALVVFMGISGSGKSSLAFGRLYAEAQRRYLESVSSYARRLFHQISMLEVDAIDGLPPAVALKQQRGSPTTPSSVGSVTTLSNLLRRTVGLHLTLLSILPVTKSLDTERCLEPREHRLYHYK